MLFTADITNVFINNILNFITVLLVGIFIIDNSNRLLIVLNKRIRLAILV